MADHKHTIREFYAAICAGTDRHVIPPLLCEDFQLRGSLGPTHRGHKGFGHYMDFVRNALGNYRCEIVEMIAEDNKVYARMLYSGTHQGELFGFAPTHARIQWDGVAVFAFKLDKIAELWVLGDVHHVIKQLSPYLER